MAEENTVATWRIVLAFVLDLIVSFLVIGYVIAALTGNLSEGGFEMNGAPALVTFALVIVYFIAMGRYAGGTLFQRLLGARRK